MEPLRLLDQALRTLADREQLVTTVRGQKMGGKKMGPHGSV